MGFNQIWDIKLILDEKSPDIAIFSEVNIFSQDMDYELHLPGYSLLLPKTMNLIGNFRIAILVREGIIVETLDKFMEIMSLVFG